MQRLFYENVNLCFENIYEAGYSYKYKNEIWQPQEENETPLSDTPCSKNTSYKERGKSFQLTKRTRSGSGQNSLSLRVKNPAVTKKDEFVSKKGNRCC